MSAAGSQGQRLEGKHVGEKANNGECWAEVKSKGVSPVSAAQEGMCRRDVADVVVAVLLFWSGQAGGSRSSP